MVKDIGKHKMIYIYNKTKDITQKLYIYTQIGKSMW